MDLLETAISAFCAALQQHWQLPPDALEIMEREKLSVCETLRQQLGGDNHYIAKKPRSKPDPERVVKSYLETTPSEAARRHGISRATLYRLLKGKPSQS